MDIHIIIEKGEEGYLVYSPELTGCTSWGNTIQEARENMKEAVHGHMLVLKQYGEEVHESPVIELLHV